MSDKKRIKARVRLRVSQPQQGYSSTGYEIERLFQEYLAGNKSAKSRLIEAVKREVEGRKFTKEPTE